MLQILSGVVVILGGVGLGPHAGFSEFPIFGPLVISLLGAGLVWQGGTNLFGPKRDLDSTRVLHNATLWLTQSSYPIGGKVEGMLRIQPSLPLEVIDAKVVVVSVAIFHDRGSTMGMGGGPMDYIKTLAQTDLPLALPPKIVAPLDQPIDFELPMNLPPTWKGRNNRFVTRVEVRIQAAGHSVPLAVSQDIEIRPELAR